MIIKYHIQDRQTGKTTSLVKEFLKVPDETVFICFNNDNKKHIVNLVGDSFKNRVVSMTEIIDTNFSQLKGLIINKILIDEYDFIKNKKSLTINNLLPNFYDFRACEIIIKTTRKNNLMLAQTLSASNVIVDLSNVDIDQKDRDEINDLCNDLISSRYTKIYDKNGLLQ